MQGCMFVSIYIILGLDLLEIRHVKVKFFSRNLVFQFRNFIRHPKWNPPKYINFHKNFHNNILNKELLDDT